MNTTGVSSVLYGSLYQIQNWYGGFMEQLKMRVEVFGESTGLLVMVAAFLPRPAVAKSGRGAPRPGMSVMRSQAPSAKRLNM
jgi:hypothetical protein